jgi:integrase/recombinase XerD
VIPGYLAHLEGQGYSVATIDATRRWLEHLQAFLACNSRELLSIKDSHLTDYQRSLSWSPGPGGKLYAANSANQAVDVIRRFYRWAHAEGLLSKDPAAHLRTRRVAPRPRRELTATEARQLLAQPNLETFGGARDRAILGLVLEVPMSPPALARLDLEHFQPDTGALWLSGRRSGIVSLSDGLAEDLVAYLRKWRAGVAIKDEPALFVSPRGRRMTGGAFRTIIRAHAQRAQVPIPHSSL